MISLALITSQSKLSKMGSCNLGGYTLKNAMSLGNYDMDMDNFSVETPENGFMQPSGYTLKNAMSLGNYDMDMDN